MVHRGRSHCRHGVVVHRDAVLDGVDDGDDGHNPPRPRADDVHRLYHTGLIRGEDGMRHTRTHRRWDRHQYRYITSRQYCSMRSLLFDRR